MKTQLTILTTFILLLMMNVSFASIRTVSNYPPITAQYPTIQAAIDASVSGDTVYVHGSPTGYAGFDFINKRLVIIGPGWSPDKTNPLTVIVVTASAIRGAGSNRTEIQGIVFANRVFPVSCDSLRFIRNKFEGSDIELNQSPAGYIYKGYLFEGNVFSGSYINANSGTVYQDFVIQNNYFYSTTGENMRGLSNPLNTVLIDHNLWFGPSSSAKECFSFCGSLLITNNIFVRREAASEILIASSIITSLLIRSMMLHRAVPTAI